MATHEVLVLQTDDASYWRWQKRGGDGDIVAHDRGNWTLEEAVKQALEANPDVEAVKVMRPDDW